MFGARVALPVGNAVRHGRTLTPHFSSKGELSVFGFASRNELWLALSLLFCPRIGITLRRLRAHWHL
jgi:hypothetical protein